MSTVEKLLDATKDIWACYYKHPFVMGIQNGTLDRDKFRFYIIQDYLYLEEYAKTYAIGVAKSKNIKIAQMFAKSIEIMNGEMDVHSGYMGKFGVSQEEADSTKRSLDNLSYTSYMLRVAYEEGEAEIIAAILSCGYSYELIAKNMIKNRPECINDEFYGDWIKGYASEEYAESNRILFRELEELTANYSEKQINHLIDIFTVCSRYELLFWEMAWNKSI
ncbi:thiaminase II [Oribacterium sp. WCC10]|uniref:thiaminase II n=1 Tax=Oribacterium sp. WCC10 TaxID=1855343 RepID=UPI0008E33299|nr:thiaminase II [Oribacterium sp. WCC10]SFG45908.1 thiaminase (transcriptional activator TenA) [Oribacterium sp. WCC10]